MKKLLSILALALCFVACQNDGVETVSNSDLVDVVLTVDAPELSTTRANEVVKTGNSAYGAIDFMTDADWADFDLRYILEVYAENEDGTGTPIYSERLVNCLDKYAPTTFALRLVPGRTYKFVVFADFVREGNAELTEPADKLAIADLYYNTADLRNISAITDATYEKGNWDAMNDNRDAYFVTENVLVNTNLTKTLTLTRPFAKLRVITTDLSYIEGYTKPAYVDIAYHDTEVYSSFNAVNGNLNDVMTVAPAYSFKVDKNAPYTEGYDKFDTNQTLFVDYLFAKNEQTPVNFIMTVWEAAADGSKGTKIHEHDFNTQIPIERNHLTTIIGDLLTVQENIVIEIDDDFAEKEIIRGWGDDNVDVTAWEAGKLNSNGDYEFIVKGDNDFLVTVNGAAVENDKLAVGTYVLAEDAEEGAELTFTVQNLQANETTRALVDVKVIGGTMVVEYKQNEYHITLDLVIEYDANEDARHAVYVYEGAIEFGATLATPEVEAVVNGLNITLTWAAVEGAESYTVTPEGEMPAIIEATEETTYTYTYEALEYNTEYSFTVVAVGQDITSVATTVKVTTGLATLATPVVKEPVVEGKVINLEWDAIEGAAAYSITVGTEMPAIVEEPKYTFNATDYNTEYTFNIVAIPADETKFNASEAAVVTVKSGAEEDVETYKLYFNNLANWSKVYAHIWANDGEDLGLESVDWPGRELTETEELDGVTYYVFQLPAEATGKTLNVVFNDGAGTQTEDLAGVVEGNLFFDNYVEPVAPSEVVLYLQPNANWNVDSARFAAYFFGNGETWVDMTLVEGETNIYAVTVPAGFENIIFCRMNPGAAANNWNNKWNQTADLKVPTDGTNLYTVTENTWDNGGGEWSVYAPAVVEPTVLATPVVEAAVEGNVITLTWTAIENAAKYGITVGTEMPVFVEGTTYVFTGEYETEYTFNVVAVPADEEKFAVSEAAVVTATTEAAPVVEPTYTTVAEFLAADVDETTFYTLKGTITRVANTSYGNFDLTDETGTIYVYGLYSEDGATNKYWAASGAKLGDDIVISAVRAAYNGSAQAGSARFLGLTSPGTLAFWSFSKTATTFTSAAGEQVITVEAYNLTDAITVASDNAQFTASYADGALTITAAENTTTETINGNITVTAGALEQVITVAQGGVSVGGGTEVAAEATMKSFGWANAADVKEAKIDDNVTVTFDQGKASNAPKYYTSGEAVRLYQNGATMTVSANGKTIKSMEITFASNMYYIAPDSGEFSAEGSVRTWTGDATEVKFTTTGTDKDHRAYISAIKVTYID
ncbi:MAG: starch-binding protein [Alistipes sp.]|nr:starch-binding protein [Alistipes sp.]